MEPLVGQRHITMAISPLIDETTANAARISAEYLMNAKPLKQKQKGALLGKARSGIPSGTVGERHSLRARILAASLFPTIYDKKISHVV